MSMDHYNQWLESDEGKGAINASNMILPQDAEFLRNRIWRAFHAGMEAGRRDEAKRIKEIISKLLGVDYS